MGTNIANMYTRFFFNIIFPFSKLTFQKSKAQTMTPRFSLIYDKFWSTQESTGGQGGQEMPHDNVVIWWSQLVSNVYKAILYICYLFLSPKTNPQMKLASSLMYQGRFRPTKRNKTGNLDDYSNYM